MGTISSVDQITPILEMFKGIGTAAPLCAVLFWVYWAERSERRELSDKVVTMIQTSVTAEQSMTNALNLLAAKIK